MGDTWYRVRTSFYYLRILFWTIYADLDWKEPNNKCCKRSHCMLRLGYQVTMYLFFV